MGGPGHGAAGADGPVIHMKTTLLVLGVLAALSAVAPEASALCNQLDSDETSVTTDTTVCVLEGGKIVWVGTHGSVAGRPYDFAGGV